MPEMRCKTVVHLYSLLPCSENFLNLWNFLNLLNLITPAAILLISIVNRFLYSPPLGEPEGA